MRAKRQNMFWPSLKNFLSGLFSSQFSNNYKNTRLHDDQKPLILDCHQQNQHPNQYILGSFLNNFRLLGGGHERSENLILRQLGRKRERERER